MTKRQLSTLGVALICGLVVTGKAQATPFYTTVDQQNSTGFMAITSYGGSYNNISGQWTISITATDQSPTIAYNDVDLTLQFVYPGDSMGNAIGPGFTYTGANVWNSGGGDVLAYTGASVPLGSVLMSDTNAPQTWTSNTWGANVNGSDVVPLVELGNFAPLGTENFTLTATPLSGGSFLFVTVGFFVVPEPASVAMMASGAALLLLAKFRRRRKSE